MNRKLLSLPFYFLLFTCISLAQTLAPGGPGKDAQWATAGKQAIGTSATLNSKVWFTLADGVMTEVYYPGVTVANVQCLQFVVVNPKTKKVETEKDDAIHQIKVLRPDSLTFQQINTAKSGEWKISKTYTIDQDRNTILIRVAFEPKVPSLNLLIYYDPSLKNSGMHDTAWTQGGALLAKDEDVVSALMANPSFNRNIDQEVVATSLTVNGFLGVNDGLTELRKRPGELNINTFDRAENGNVVQTSFISPTKYKTTFRQNVIQFTPGLIAPFTIAFGFAKNENDAIANTKASLTKGFDKCLTEYEKGWTDYVKTLPRVDPKYQAQFNMAAMVLKAHEDKTRRGANIASLSIPWGGGANANENNVGGYHLVWARDLYQVATAYMALGDKAAAERALDFLFNVQQKMDGSFPQNSWLDGKPFWGSLQMDEVVYPLILAYQLGKNDKATYENHIKKAADFIVKNGPATPQERWEEEGGYSPSTIAAEIAGLVCAADIAQKNGDGASAKIYLATADNWQANIEKWTATTTGRYGDGNYYLRIAQNGKPDAGDKIEINNGAGMFDEREIVDAGFLELVRLGIKPPDDPLIAKSLKVIDQVIKVDTPNGAGFYRYNHDGYGEMDDGRPWNWDGKYKGKGRLWPLLSGERGEYQIAECGSRNADLSNSAKSKCLDGAKSRLEAMQNFANEGLMIPEQVWDMKEAPKQPLEFSPELKFGEGTGSATPLAWSMAQFIRLATNLKAGKNLETPQVVYDRYILGKNAAGQTATSVTDARGSYQNLPNPKLNYLVKMQPPNPQIIRCGNSKECDRAKQMQACIAFDSAYKTVEIAGDFTGWKPRKLETTKKSDGPWLNACLPFAKTARVEYKLIANGKWILDPLNLNKVDNGVGGENSVFTMPDYKPTWWDRGKTSKLDEFDIASKDFGIRTVKVYVPQGISSDSLRISPSAKRGHPSFVRKGVKTAPLPVLYMQDGSDYINRAKAVQIQYNLVKAGKIKPFIMVFIDPKDRMKEYWANDQWADFIAKEVVPEIDKRYRTIKNRGGRALLGASLGGVTSIWTALKHSDIFARVGGQSSSFWIDNERVVKALEDLDGTAKFKFYLDDGTLEGVDDSRKVVKILQDKGFDVTYNEAEAGHNWTAWRDRLAGAFVSLWK